MAANIVTMPARGHSTAPKFDIAQPRELHRYFNELDLLFTACNITNEELMKQHACRYLDIDSSELWESLPEFSPGITYDVFRTAVYKLYPGSDDDRKWSISDMDKLVGEQLRTGILDANDLGAYYRSFFNITQFLRAKNRISDAEQSRAFVRGFQSGLWTRIARRLELKFPDHYPDDPYTLDDIHSAAKFVLAGSTTRATAPAQVTSSGHSHAAPATGSSPYVKSEDLSAILDRFAATIATALAVPKSAPAPRTNAAPHQDSSASTLTCIFCSLLDHFINECLTCQQYINDGKCKKNAEGKIVLANGQFTPRNIPGRYIKDRVDEWIRRNPGVLPSPALMYGIVPSPVSSSSPRGVYPIANLTNHSDDRIAALERELYALRSGRNFNCADNNPAPVPPSNQQPNPVIPPTSVPSTAACETTIPPPSIPSSTIANPSTSTTTANQGAGSSTQPPIHPFAGIRENAYLPPHERNFAGAPRPREGPSYHTHAPIQSEQIAQDVFNRTMKTPIITLTSEELLSLSPEVRAKLREQITSKRVAQDPATSANMLAPGSIILADPYETYINSLAPGEIPEPFVVAKDSHAIRSLYMNINGSNKIESVVDPGSSIIAMSEEVCHELGLPYDPSIRLPMQSANGGIDETLGLARNVPCEIGNITLYMQIHIIRNPAYEILLGRPFDVLTESVIRNYRNEAQTITVRDPNSTRSVTVPSFPRGNKRRKLPSQDFRA